MDGDLRSAALANALIDKGFRSIQDLDVPEAQSFDVSPFAFVGWKPRWGSLMTVAVHAADGVDAKTGSDRLDLLYGLTGSLRKHAGSIDAVRLGSFGMLMHAFRSGSPPALRSELVSQRRGGAWRHDYCLTWVLDLEKKQAYRHRGLPLTMYPGHKWITEVLHREVSLPGTDPAVR